jgi:hypothetical protein
MITLNLSTLPVDVLERVVSSLDDRSDIAAFARVSSECRSVALRVDESAARDARLLVRRYVTTEENARWALANGCPLTTKTFEIAAEQGNLDVLRALRERKCPHDSKACMKAASRGHLEALEWMMARGFGTNFLTCAAAVGSKFQEAKRVVEWLGGMTPLCPCGGTYH